MRASVKNWVWVVLFAILFNILGTIGNGCHWIDKDINDILIDGLTGIIFGIAMLIKTFENKQ